MMKIYAQSLINSIQNVVNSGNIKLTTFKDYSFLTYLCSTLLKIRFIPETETSRRDTVIISSNSDIKAEFMKEWFKSAPGKFVTKDFKKDNKDFIGNTLYHELKLSINNKSLKILVRLLKEITEEITEETKNELIEQYGDLTIDGKYFSIIKICDDSDKYDWGYNDIYHSKDYELILNNDNNSYIETTNDEDNEANEPEDTTASSPLF